MNYMNGNVSAGFVSVQGPGVSASAGFVSANFGVGCGPVGIGMAPCGLPMGIPVVGGIPIGGPRTMIGGIPMIPVGQPMMPVMYASGFPMMPPFAGTGNPQFNFLMAQAQLQAYLRLMGNPGGIGGPGGTGNPFPGIFLPQQRQQAVNDLGAQFDNRPVNPGRVQAILNQVPPDQRLSVLKEVLGVDSDDPKDIIAAFREGVMDGQVGADAQKKAGKLFFNTLGDLVKNGALSPDELTREVARARSAGPGPWRDFADGNESYLNSVLRNAASDSPTEGTGARTRLSGADLNTRKADFRAAAGPAGAIANVDNLADALDAMKDDRLPEAQKIAILKNVLAARGVPAARLSSPEKIRQEFLKMIIEDTANWADAKKLIQAYRRAFSNDNPRQMQRDMTFVSNYAGPGSDREEQNRIIALEP